MEKLEKLIYSVKYLPGILYFGSFGIILFDACSYIFMEEIFIPDLLSFPLFFLFLYMTHLIVKNYKKKK